MIKYAVHTEHFEFNPTKYKTAEDAFFTYDDHWDKQLGIFDTLEEARAFLKTISVSSHRYSYTLADATVAFIMEADYDLNDDGEWEFIEGADYWDFKCEPLKADSRW